MAKVKFRATSILKLETAATTIDETFGVAATMETLFDSAVNAMVQDVGTQKTIEVFNQKISEYKSDYMGLSEEV
jgi:hypothetical protein